YWDGTTDQFGSGDPVFSIKFAEKVSIPRFIKEPSLTFGEAYMKGLIQVEGKIEDIINTATANASKIWSRTLTRFPAIPSIQKNKKEVQHHYDIGNDFYSLWL